MWIQRTPDELADRQKTAQAEATSHGLLICAIVWAIVTVCLAGGWYVFFAGGAGFAVQRDVAESFWVRVPVCGLAALPFAFVVFWYERRKQSGRNKKTTICPKCDTIGEGNPGASCHCGGSYVLLSTVKWVED